MEISEGADCCCPPSEEEEKERVPGVPMVSSILGSHPAPHSNSQTLTFEGELDPGGSEAVVLGMGSPPAQSQQGGPEEDTNHGHGGHAPGRRDRGESGGAEPAKEGTRGREVSSLHPPLP